ncbi:MAG: 2,3,4,5-tetrahydropyridine-2,6-dicarboxylate N-succinyltransferase [Candidatus Paracaedibacteraceae bacterium]|nr:2,3,4,5-tetrahydropyridine-2,6-dicarboxylate N-succinyltransferase [Candidatus Paracaedibacteraceae bacterium]
MPFSIKQKQIDLINAAFDGKSPLNGAAAEAIRTALTQLNEGTIRVCEKKNGIWETNQWLKKAILLSFRLNQNQVSGDGGTFAWFDKIPLKTENWNQAAFASASIRMVPGAIVRKGAFIERNVILMPSFINIGAYIGEGTLVDTWSTVGSCAQIGKNCHISGGVGIGGVLEPIQSNPVIIEDNCFIGARSELAEGVIVEEGAVISMGVFIGASTKIVDRATGEITYGRVPAYSVVVPGVLPSPQKDGIVIPHLACAVIVKRVDEKTRSKTSINEILRECSN